MPPARLFLAAFLAIGCGAPAIAGPPAWVLAEGSGVGFTTSQAGAPVNGRFEVFEAQIGFDAADLAAGTVEVLIDTSSVTTGAADRDTATCSKDLFDVEAFPTAYFEVTSFRHEGGERYRAEDRLTMRDATRDVVLPFTLHIAPGETLGQLRARARGSLTVDRLDYGIGKGLFRDTSVVPNAVEIHFDIQAIRKAP